MRNALSLSTCARATLVAIAALMPMTASAADIYVPAGGNLQAAIDAARGGDTILLQPGATYTGNFRLRVHEGTDYITIRSAADDALLPRPGARITPAYGPQLARIKSPNTTSAVRTDPRAAYWRLMFLELAANVTGAGNILSLGDGSSAQTSLDQVPHHLIVDRVWIRGDRLHGQKRGIGLNSGDTTIVGSYISDAKAIGQDAQAIAGWNGPGPYRIENNFLEASTEVFLLGGDDPKISGLTPSDIVVRGNTLSRPVSWRSPIVPTPQNVRASLSEGLLAAGTYAYRVVARRPASTTTARSAASLELAVTVGAGGGVSLTWDPVPDATEYLVYGRAPGAQNVYWKVTQPAFFDNGASAATSGTPSSSGTVWQVKNIFELKNARRVQVDHNLMENNWSEAQSGVAIMLTPRNQYGGCTWCGVQDVVFEQNIVRHTGAGVKILGDDDNYPSLQTTNIVIRHNEFSDVSKTWGGNGYFLTLISGPRNITVDHNTIISPSGSGIVAIDLGIVEQFTYTNNVARHNNYGIQGSGSGYGNTAIAAYLPGSTITANVFAGGSSSRYPAGNLFPTLASFEAHFVDYPASDFALVPGTNWQNAGTDGLDLGADMAAVRAPVDDGTLAVLQVTTTSLPGAVEGALYTATLEAAGGTPPYIWDIVTGALPSGVTLDAATGTIGGVSTSYGDFPLTVRVRDNAGRSATQPLTLTVNRFIPPVELLTSALPGGMVGAPYSQALVASGGLGTYEWALTAGSLPAGLTLGGDGSISGVPSTVSASGDTFAITVSDSSDSSRSATRVLGIAIAPPPLAVTTASLPETTEGDPYAAALQASGGVAPYQWALIEGALPSGLVLNGATGSISGTAAGYGDFTLTVEVTDADGRMATQPLTLHVTRFIAPVALLTGALADGMVGAPYTQTLTASGGLGTYSWTITAGSLPAGLTLGADGTIEGVPTAVVSGGRTFEITVADAADASRAASRTLAIAVLPPPLNVTTVSLPSTTERDPYSALLEASGGVAPYEWAIVAGALPSGLVLNTETGTISGSAGSYGDFSLSVRVTDVDGRTATQPLMLHVARFIPPVTLVTSTLPGGVVGTAYAQGLIASGGLGTYSWALTAGSLPAGLTLGVDGAVSGTPTAVVATGQTFEITVRDAAEPSRAASGTFAIVVAPRPNIPPTVRLLTPADGAQVTVGTIATLLAEATDDDGVVRRVDFFVNNVKVGEAAAAPFSNSWSTTATGTYSLVAVATDDAGATVSSAPVSVAVVAPAKVLLYAADVTRIVGDFQLVADTTAAGGRRLWNPNRGVAKLSASATPANYAEFTFYAEAGRQHHLWIRGKAERNTYTNDSVWVQFSEVSAAPIGTTTAAAITLEDYANAGVSGWGWQDNGFGAGVKGAPIVFSTSGFHTIRIQPREDGLSIDQILLSTTYPTPSPGALKNDTTILSR
jgi:hypothetical protein